MEQGLFGPQALLTAGQLEGGGGGDTLVEVVVVVASVVVAGGGGGGGDVGGGSLPVLAHALEILISAQFQN